MQKTTLFVLLITFATIVTVEAQKKSELFARIEILKTEKDSVKQALNVATRKISVAEAEAETLRNENVTLRDANATLMKNLSGFSELSKKSSQNANNALARLEAREKQLGNINDTFTTIDSTAIALLTRSKQILGDESKLGVAGGDIVISNSLTSLFGNDSGTQITNDAKDWLGKIAQLAQSAPERLVVIEGMNITGEFGLTYQQIATVASELVKSHGIAAENIRLASKDGNFKEGINIRLEPNHERFYNMVKQDVRN